MHGLKARNAMGKTSKLSHHCTMCHKAATPRCLKQGHIAFCEVCTYQFNVKSRGGCSVHPYSEGYNKAALANLRGFEPNFNPLDEPDPVADTQVEAEQEADSTAAPQKIKGAYNEAWKKVGQTEYKKKRDQLDPQEPTNKQRGKNLQPVLAVTAMAKEDKKLRKTRK